MPSLEQLKAEASRCDRMAELHTEKVTEWLLKREQQLAAGNRETAAEYGCLALAAEELVQRNLDRALECRRQASAAETFGDFLVGRFKAA